MDNKEGLEQITRNMESRSLYSSVGVVERALNQMEDYDFLVVSLLSYYIRMNMQVLI